MAKNLFKKKVGIVNHCINEDDRNIEGEELNRKLIEKYQNMTNPEFKEHCNVKWPANYRLPDDWQQEMQRRMSSGKTMTFSCIPDSLFRFRSEYDPRSTKIDLIKRDLALQVFDPDFWVPFAIDMHLQGRLIPLNKIFPNIPTMNDVRFIVAASPVQKALESVLFKITA